MSTTPDTQQPTEKGWDGSRVEVINSQDQAVRRKAFRSHFPAVQNNLPNTAKSCEALLIFGKNAKTYLQRNTYVLSRNSLFQMPPPRSMDVGVLFLCCFMGAVLIYMTLHDWRAELLAGREACKAVLWAASAGETEPLTALCSQQKGPFFWSHSATTGVREMEREKGGGGGGLRERREREEQRARSACCVSAPCGDGRD